MLKHRWPHWSCIWRLAIVWTMAIFLWLPLIFAADDDEDPTSPESISAKRFDQIFFGRPRDPDGDAARQRLELRLKQRIEIIHRRCQLSDDQLKKLDLAGRRTIQQLFDALKSQKQAFVKSGRNELAAAQFFNEDPEILTLRRKLRNGPFEEQSLFGKVVAGILTAEQSTKYESHISNAADSGRPITVENVANLVRIARQPIDAYRAVWSRDGRQLGLLHYNQQLQVFARLDDAPVRVIGEAKEAQGVDKGKRLLGFDFGSQSNRIVTVQGDNTLSVHGQKESDGIHIKLPDTAYGVRFSPNEKTLVTGGYGIKSRLWSAETGEMIREYTDTKVEGGLTPEFSPDGKILAVGNRNSTTALFDVETGKVLHTLGRNMSHGLAFHPKGTTIAVTYVDSSLSLWNVDTGKSQSSVRAWADELYTVDWTPDGRMLVTGGYNTPLTFWNAADLSVIAEFDTPEWIMSVRFSPDGSKLAVAGMNRDLNDRHVEIWAVP